jgi:hypothetical protein
VWLVARIGQAEALVSRVFSAAGTSEREREREREHEHELAEATPNEEERPLTTAQ